MYTDKQKEEAINFLKWLYTKYPWHFENITDEEIKEVRSSYLFKLWRKDEAVREFKEVFIKDIEPIVTPIINLLSKIINTIIKKS